MRLNGFKEEQLNLSAYKLYRRTNNGTLEVERESLFIEDGTKTITQIDDDGTTQTIRYQYDNHLGSASLELDENAEIISYEEYHPFGTTSFRSGRSITEVSLKRYKYVGKERDNETGLYYYGARYYADWIGRFVSVDPLQHKYPHYTPFQYAGNKPVTFIDLDGLEEAKKDNDVNVINTGNKEFDTFANRTIEAFGLSGDTKVTININNVDGEFVGGSISITKNDVNKTINFTPQYGFSDLNISFYNGFQYNNIEAIADNTNVVLQNPVPVQEIGQTSFIPKTETPQLKPDYRSTWRKNAVEENFNYWDNQRKINEHIKNLQTSDPFNFGDPGTVGVGMVPSLYEGMKQVPGELLQELMLTRLLKLQKPLKTLNEYSKLTKGKYKGLGLGYRFNTIRRNDWLKYNNQLQKWNRFVEKSSKSNLDLIFKSLDAEELIRQNY